MTPSHLRARTGRRSAAGLACGRAGPGRRPPSASRLRIVSTPHSPGGTAYPRSGSKLSVQTIRAYRVAPPGGTENPDRIKGVTPEHPPTASPVAGSMTVPTSHGPANKVQRAGGEVVHPQPEHRRMVQVNVQGTSRTTGTQDQRLRQGDADVVLVDQRRRRAPLPQPRAGSCRADRRSR
jgi:hypothetical protein